MTAQNFQGFTVEHMPGRTILYPFCDKYKTVCVYLEDDGSYVAHSGNANKMGKLDKARHEFTLLELQELCKLVLP